jgi:hypothetical protein
MFRIASGTCGNSRHPLRQTLLVEIIITALDSLSITFLAVSSSFSTQVAWTMFSIPDILGPEKKRPHQNGRVTLKLHIYSPIRQNCPRSLSAFLQVLPYLIPITFSRRAGGSRRLAFSSHGILHGRIHRRHGCERGQNMFTIRDLIVLLLSSRRRHA